jgi:hypothetical protein
MNPATGWTVVGAVLAVLSTPLNTPQSSTASAATLMANMSLLGIPGAWCFNNVFCVFNIFVPHQFVRYTYIGIAATCLFGVVGVSMFVLPNLNNCRIIQCDDRIVTASLQSGIPIFNAVYARFTEGHDTQKLREVKQLLAELQVDH